MARGKAAKVGETRVSPNGYHYTRTETCWELTHHIVAEKHLLHRPLLDNERVVFIDGDRTNLKPENLRVTIKQGSSIARRRARLEARLADIQAQLDALAEEEQANA